MNSVEIKVNERYAIKSASKMLVIRECVNSTEFKQYRKVFIHIISSWNLTYQNRI